MRKITFVGLICLMSIVAWFNSAHGETLPKSIQEMVLKDIGFYKPVEISCSLQSGPYDIVNPFKYYSGYSWEEKILIPKGYLKAVVMETTEMTFVDHGVYRGGVRQTEWVNKPVKKHKFVITDKFRLYARNIREWKGADNVNGAFASAEIVAAKRVLKSIDYTNKWKIQPEGLDVWSFTFTYFLEPVFPELPKLGPFSGKGTAVLNPATGQWETQRGVWRGSFDSRVDSSLGDGGSDEYTAWLERQTVPSKIEPPQLPSQAPIIPETTEEALNKLKDLPPATSKEFYSFTSSEADRQYRTMRPDNYSEMIQLSKKCQKATDEQRWQDVIELSQKVLNFDPNDWVPFYSMAASYLHLGKPDEALKCAVNALQKIRYDGVFFIISEAYAQKNNKKEMLFWFEKLLKSGSVKTFGDYEKSYPYLAKYKNDLDCILLVQKYSGLGYSVTVDGKQYRVGGDIFIGGKERVFVFVDEKGAVVRDPALAKKIAQAAWVYENVVKAPGLLGSQRVSAILETHKALRRYEVAQDALARISVQTLAATISGGATLTYAVPAGLTWRVVRDQFANLKGLLSLTGRQGLEEALNKYREMEAIIAKLKPNSIDEATAGQIRELYESAYELDLPYSALLTSLMPKKGRQLVEKALKDISDELIKTLPLSDAVLTTREVLGLQGKMDDALKTDPAFKEYYEKLNLAKRLREANVQTIVAWAKQAVKYKE